MRRVVQQSRMLGIGLLLCVPLQSSWADDGESLPGPGIGNEAWTVSELWRPAGSLTSNHGYKVAYNRGFVADGHLNLIFAPDGNRRNETMRGIDVWNVSDPRRPSRVRTHRNMVFREAHGLGLWNRNGRTVLASQSQLGVAFFDVTNISERLTLLGEADLPGVDGGDYGGAWWVSVQAPYVYVATLGGGLHVVDATDPAAPRQVTRLPTGQLGGISPASVFAVGNLLVLAEAETGRGYATMDIGDPENPTLIATMDGAAGYSHLFTAGMILTSGGNADLSESPRLHVHRVGHDGSMSYVGEAGGSLGQGAYGSYQDGHFLGGFSRQVAKFTLNPLRLVGTGSSRAAGRDEEFAQPLGNLLLVTDDHGVRSTLIPHRTERDTTGPEVVWKHPPAGATDQPLTTRVGVSMSDEVAVESLLPARFRVAARDGEAVSGQLSTNQNNVNFSPDAPLAPSTTYDVEVCGVRDLVGNTGGCSSWSFETGLQEATGAAACRLGRLDPVETDTAINYAPQTTKNGPTAYEWSFGDAGTVGPQDQAAAVFTYAEPGRYAVVLEVSNAHGGSSCSAVQVVHTPLTATAPVSTSSVVVTNDGEVLADSTDIYVANPDNDTVTRIHWDLEKVWEVAVGDDPRTLTIAPNGHIWVANHGSGDITVLHPFGKPVRTIDLGYGAAPYGIVFAPDGGAAYVSLSGSGRLLKLDPGGNVVGDIAVGARPRGIAVSGDSKRVFVTRFVSAFAESGAVGEVYEVDAATFAVTRTIELEFDPGPDTESSGRGVPNYLSQIRIAPDGRSAWIASKKDNIARGEFRDGNALDFETQTRAIVSQIDLVANAERLASRIDFDDRDLAQALLFTPVGDAFMVAFQGSNRVEVWDTKERARLSEVSVGRGPAGLALDPSGRRLYVHNFLDRSLSVFNTGGLLDGTLNEPIPIDTVALVAREALAPEVLRGKRIFYDSGDPRMGRDGYISCASCHLDGGSDQMVWDRTQAGEGLRNTIDLRGRRGTNGGFVHWTSNFDEIQDFEHDMRDGFGGTGFMSDADFGTGTRNKPLGDPKAGASAELDALAAYVTSLDSVLDSPHRASDGSLTATGRKGRATFTRKGCAACHAGTDFTDDRRHDVGTHDASSGKGSAASLDGVGLNTPTLKGLWIGAPYLHNGSAATLMDVLDNTTHMGSALTSEEKEEIAAFLVQIDDGEPGVPVAGEVARDDASLSILGLSGIDIGTFDAATTAYAASVGHGVSSTTVTATPQNDAASVTIQDADGSTAGTSRTSNLAVGANAITATVTAEDGATTRNYTVTVTRVAAPPVASITADTGSLSEGSSAGFTVSLDKAASEALTLPLSVSETGQTLNGAATSVSIAQGATSAALTLATVDDNVVEEDSTITVQLSAGDGYTLGTSLSAQVSVEDNDAATFTVNALPSEIEEGGAADVTVGIANGVVFGADQELALTASGTASADDYALSATALTLAAGDGAATATLTATEDAAAEEAETVTVTASHGGADVGTATVTIAANTAPLSDDATLSALVLSGIDIAFDSATMSYSAKVGNGVESTTTTATPNDAAAEVMISDAQGSTAGTSRATALGVGTNAIAVAVTAVDGETSLTYTVEVTRAALSTWGERRPGRDIDVTAAERPTGLWSDGETMWVADWGNSKALAYTLADGARLASSDVSLRETYSASGLWSDGETLWAADYNGGVLAYGLADGNRRSGRDLDGEVLAAAGNARPGGVWSDGKTAWVGDHNDGKVYAYGLADKARLPDAEFTLQAEGLNWVRPFGLWSNGQTLLASSWDQGVVRAYRLSDGARIADLDIAASANAYAADLWSDGETLWVLDDQNRKLLAYALTESGDGEQKSADATLSALTLSGIDIGTFDAATTDYAATVAHDVSYTTVTATATDAGASVTIAGGGDTATDAAFTAALASGTNTITATVTAEDGQTTRSYTVTVTRGRPSADATLSALTLSGIDIGAFDAATTNYTSTVPHDASTTTVAATVTDVNASVTIAAGEAMATDGPLAVTLEYGSNTIAATVTAEDESTTLTYTVTVRRESPATGANLMADGSFEDTDSGWTLSGGATRVEADTTEGSYHLAVTGQGGAEQLVTGLQANTRYVLTASGRTTGETPLIVGVRGHGSNDESMTFASADFETRSIAFTTGFTSTSATIFVHKTGGSGTGYADGVTLTRGTGSEFALLWSDEFNGSGAVDATKWTFEDGFVRNRELQWYQPDNAFQENGNLVIEGRRQTFRNPNYAAASADWRTNREFVNYTSSSLTTRNLNHWKYGKTVVRAKVTNETGTWPAIWTKTGNGCKWPAGGEVDVMENFGGRIWAVFHWGGDPGSPAKKFASRRVRDLGADWTDEFHIWEWDWDRNRMSIFVDGTKLEDVALEDTVNGTYDCPGQNPFRQPHFLLINLALGSTGGSVADLDFPTRYLVDYVRVYSKVNNTATGQPKIAGVLEVGETLAADISKIGDLDGLSVPGFSYRWIRVTGAARAEIEGATSATYTVSNDDVDSAFALEVSFTDDAGSPETVVSEVTAVVSGQEEQKSDDATLAALALTGVDIGTFDAATTDYAATVAHGVSSTTVTATATDAGASVTIAGGGDTATDAGLTVALAVGANTITATVTAEDGQTTQAYAVTVVRETPSNDATLSALALSAMDIGTFDAATTDYAATVAHDVSSTTVTAAATDAGASVTITGGGDTATDGPLTVSLGYGSNTITAAVTAEDSETVRTYTVTVTRPRIYTVASPDASLEVLVTSTGTALSYAVSRNGSELVGDSPLSIRDSEPHRVTGSATASLDSTWMPTWGQFSSIRDRHNRLTLNLDVGGTAFDLVVRVYDDGLGLRFEAKEQAALTGTTVQYNVTYNLQDTYQAYWPHEEFSPEGPHAMNALPASPPLVTPLVIDTGAQGYFALLESDLYSAKAFGSIRFQRVSGQAAVTANVTSTAVPAGAFVTPWRVLLVGDGPGDMLSSTVTVNLAAPLTSNGDVGWDWVKPGKALWIWRIRGYETDDGFTYGNDTASLKRLIDFAADNGIEYVVVDAQWYTRIDNGTLVSQKSDFDIEEITAHGDDEGVGVFIYADRKYPSDAIRNTTDKQLFALYDDLGGQGVKYGFKYDDAAFTRAALQGAAADELLINFHDEPTPMTGARRTMPNAITREGGFAQQDERRSFTPTDYLEMAMINALLGPFDQNNGIYRLDSVDGTAGTSRQPVNSTVAGENARLLITFSGLIVLPDPPEEYAKKSDLFEFVKRMPATWDETRVLASSLPHYITTARRSGENWFVCSATNETARTLSIPLEFLDADVTYDITYYEDDHDGATPTHYINNRETYQIRTGTVTGADTVDAVMVAGGGHCMWMRPEELGGSAATGSPTITGTPQVGERLTASTAGIADGDGLEDAEFSYQWIRNDGAGDADIADATSQAYTPVSADADKTLKVRVTFTDDGGTQETLTSVATGPVAARSALSVADAEASEEDDPAIGFVVTLDPAAARTVTVDYATADGTATAGEDYGATSGTLTFDVGETSKTVSVPIVDDAVEDGGETLTLALSSATVAEIADASATGTIRNAEVATPLTASFHGVPAEHDGTTEFTLELRFSEEVRVSYLTLRDESLEAQGGTVRRAQRIEQGSNVRWRITVAPEADGDVTVTLRGGVACDSAGAVCTQDGRPLSNSPDATVPGPASSAVDVTIAADAASVAEGTDATFTLTRAGDASSELTVAVEVTETGAMISGVAPSQATIAAGASTGSLAVATADDAVVEADSAVTVTLVAGTGYRIPADAGSAETTVMDDDEASWSVTASPESLAEGDSATLTVAVTNGVTFAEQQAVALAVSGTVSPDDYTLSADALTLASGSASVSATLTAVDDAENEEAETATVQATVAGTGVGTATVTVAASDASSDATLSALSLTGIDIGTFDPATTSYAGAVEHDVDSTTVTATAADEGATVRLAGGDANATDAALSVSLEYGSNTITATVTAENGTSTKTYTVTVTRESPSDDATLSALSLSGIDIGTFDAATTSYAVTVAHDVSSTTVTATTTDAGATVTLAAGESSATDGSLEVSLEEGANIITAAVTAENGTSTKTYTVTVTWESPSDDATLSALSLSGIDIGTFDAATTGYAVTVAHGVSSTTVTATTTDAGATVTLAAGESSATDGPLEVSLEEGVNTITATVTAANGTSTKTYTVTVTRERSDDATLSALVLSGIDIGMFNAATTSYAVTVAHDVSSTTVRGTTTDADATVTLAAGEAGATDEALAVSLAYGSNTITATVTAANGTRTKTYTVTVTRERSSDGATLSALSLSGIDIGTFDAATTSYAVTVAHDVSSTTVTATAADEGAEVEIADGIGSTVGTERTVQLSVGETEITVTVTAVDGVAVQTYTVTVTRSATLAWGDRLPDRDMNLNAASRPTALWSDGETLWVAEWGDYAVYAYDLTGQRVSDKDLTPWDGGFPTGMWSDGETLWMSDYYAGVLGYRLSDGERLESADVAPLAADNAAGVWSDGDTLWVADHFDGKVYAYGLSDKARRESSEFALVSETQPFGLWSDGKTVLVGSWGLGRVYAFRLSDGARLSERDIDTSASGNRKPIGLWSDGETLWVVEDGGQKAYAYAVPGLEPPPASSDSAVLVTSRAPRVPSTAPGVPVWIPDAGLRGRIEVALGKAPGQPIGNRELAALESLDARAAEIADLTGLEGAVNLVGLDLGHNSVADFTLLGWLPALRVLNADGMPGVLESLVELPDLERLSLRSAGLADLNAVWLPMGLRVLDVGGNRLADLDALWGLPGLRVLHADGNAIREVAVLAGLGDLRVLDLRGNRVSDLRPLGVLPRLERLAIGGNRVVDFTPLYELASAVVVTGRNAQRVDE